MTPTAWWLEDFGTHFPVPMERDQLPAPGQYLPPTQVCKQSKEHMCLFLDWIEEFSLPKFSIKPPSAGLKLI